MTKDQILTDLEGIKAKLEICEADSQELTGYAHQAIDLAWQAVCHAIDLITQAKDRRVM